jgi:peptide/nickel transport system permease protein
LSNVWVRFTARRLIGLVAALFLLVVAVFLSVRLIPGDPAELSLGFTAGAADKARYRHELGLDRPLLAQFGTYMRDLFRGDLGASITTSQPVGQVIRERIGPSAQLAGISLAITLIVGVPLGIIMAELTREGRRRKLDVWYQGLTQLVATIPEFLFATVLAFVFAVKLHLLPNTSTGWNGLVLPVAALALGATATLSRFVRVETLDVLAQDYVRTARSKRLPARMIMFHHVLPNVMTAALTIGGLLFAGIIGGAVIIENVFNRPGLGTILTQAMAQRDYAVIQGVTLVLGAIVIVVNVLIDFILAVIDKRSLARDA